MNLKALKERKLREREASREKEKRTLSLKLRERMKKKIMKVGSRKTLIYSLARKYRYALVLNAFIPTLMIRPVLS